MFENNDTRQCLPNCWCKVKSNDSQKNELTERDLINKN